MSHDWVKQRCKVSRKAAQSGYFTLATPSRDCRISKGIKGIAPDGTFQERAADEAAWFTAHPAITAKMRENLRVDGETKRALLHRPMLKKLSPNIGSDDVSERKGV
jgi:hypothetical protein